MQKSNFMRGVSSAFLLGALFLFSGGLPARGELGLRLYYDFEEGGGTNVIDRSGHGNNGYFVGAVARTNSQFGGAIRTSDPGTYVVSEATNLNMNGWTQMTVSVWVQMKGYTTYGHVIGKGEETGNGLLGFSMLAGGSYSGSWNGGSFGIVTNNSNGNQGVLTTR